MTGSIKVGVIADQTGPLSFAGIANANVATAKNGVRNGSTRAPSDVVPSGNSTSAQLRACACFISVMVLAALKAGSATRTSGTATARRAK